VAARRKANPTQPGRRRPVGFESELATVGEGDAGVELAVKGIAVRVRDTSIGKCWLPANAVRHFSRDGGTVSN